MTIEFYIYDTVFLNDLLVFFLKDKYLVIKQYERKERKETN